MFAISKCDDIMGFNDRLTSPNIRRNSSFNEGAPGSTFSFISKKTTNLNKSSLKRMPNLTTTKAGSGTSESKKGQMEET